MNPIIGHRSFYKELLEVIVLGDIASQPGEAIGDIARKAG